MSVWLVSCCLRWPDFRAVIARKTLKSLRESTWNTVRMIVKNWGLLEDVHYKVNNLAGSMQFFNGSIIMMLECADLPSDPNFERFGSIEISAAGCDEISEISQKAVEVLFSRIRWKVHETLGVSKMLLTTNPTTNWVRSRFVQDDDGNRVETRQGEFYVPFSVFDNPDIAFRQTYEAALHKISDQATKERLLYGNWDYVEANNMAIYNKFDGAKHLAVNLKEQVYDPSKPLVTVWDFNVAPQMSVIVAQLDYDKKKVYILDEVLGKPEEKENNTPALSRKLKNKLYRDKHIGGVDVTGDPSGLQRSTTSEDGVNNYTVIPESLSQITRGNPERMIQAEEAAEMSIVEYLSENYQVEAELNKGKYIAEYDRRITFPVGAHLYLDGQIYEVIRSLSGFKTPAHVEYWEESSDPNILIDAIPGYSQFKTYYPGDKAVYNGLCYECLVENGWKFGSIRMPLVNGWVEVVSSPWMPVEYELWDVIEHDGLFYTVVSTEDFDPNVVPSDSGNWGEIADYEPVYNDYELSGHEMVVRRIETTP